MKGCDCRKAQLERELRECYVQENEERRRAFQGDMGGYGLIMQVEQDNCSDITSQQNVNNAQEAFRIQNQNRACQLFTSEREATLGSTSAGVQSLNIMTLGT